MTPGHLVNHLDEKHGVDWADDLDADAANRVHHDHHYRQGYDHSHTWDGFVADPQPPMRTRDA